MSARISPLPASLSLPEPAPGDLEARILRAEQRLIVREENLRRRVSALGHRARDAASPRHLIKPAVGVAAGGVALWLLMRGRRDRAAAPAPPPPPARRATDRGADLPWAHWVMRLWPLLPPAVRQRTDPSTASALVALGMPLLRLALGGRRAAPLETVAQVDLIRYAGTWHEVARLPERHEDKSCAGQPSAVYTPRLDGRIEVLNRCPDGRGGVTEVAGEARPVPGSGGAKLKLNLAPAWLRWLPATWSDYWIVHLDDGYTEALVGTPRRDALWLLSRRPHLPPERVRALVRIAADRGFPVERLIFSGPG